MRHAHALPRAALAALWLPVLCLLGALAAGADAANSTYTLASPGVFIRPVLPNTKLELLNSNLTVDLDAGRFYQTVSTYYAGSDRAGTLPLVTLVGYISFNMQGKVLFSFPSTTELYCQQAISSPSLCPYLQQLVANVPYVFGAIPSSGNTVQLTLEADSTYEDPITNGPINFLGANQALTFVCSGTCAPFGSAVPPAPMAANASFTNLSVVSLTATNATIQNLSAANANLTAPVTPSDVRYYGARCDGVTDDAVALAAAFASSASVVVDGGGRRCVSNSALTLAAGKTLQNIILDFRGATVIGVSSTTYLSLSAGSLGTASLLAVSLDAGQWRVLLATPIATLAAGDYVQLASTQVYSTDDGSTFGQLALVNYVSADGLTVDLADAVFLPYSTSFGASMRKVTFAVGSTLRNVQVIGNDTGLTSESVRGILAVRTRDLLLQNVTVTNVYTQGINIQSSWNARIENSYVQNATQDGLAYGVAITNGCAFVKVSRCHFANVRHGITTGGSSSGINYQISYADNSVYAVRDAGFDMHPATYSGSITGNMVTFQKGRPPSGASDGIIFQGANGLIASNVVLGGEASDLNPTRSGISVQPLNSASVEPQSLVVQGNIVQSASIGIYVRAQSSSGSSISSLVVEGNAVTDYASFGIYVYAVTQNIRSVVISANSLFTARGTTNTHSIALRAGTGLSILDASVAGNSVSGTNSSVLRGVLVTCDATGSIAALAIASNSFANIFIGLSFSGGNLIALASLHGNVFSNTGTRVSYSSSLRPVLERTGFTGVLANDANQVLSLGSSTTLSTTATIGYVGITSCAGTPTGVPAGAAVGTIPIHYDSTNNRLYLYNSAWRGTLMGCASGCTVDAAGQVTVTGGVTSIAGSSNQIVASASTGAVTLSLFGTSTAPTLASFGTGACTGGGTPPSITLTGNTRSFYIVLVTGTGTCAADTVFTLNLGSTFSTKAICQLTDGLLNQGVSGFGVNRYIQTTTNQLILNSFTTVSPANNNLFAQLTQYEWHVSCAGY